MNEKQIKYIGLEIMNVIDKLTLKLGDNFQLTGSIALVEFNILKRKVRDIDIVVDELETVKNVFNEVGYDFQEWIDYGDKTESPTETMQKEDKVVNRVSFKIDGIKIDTFFDKNQSFSRRYFGLERKLKVSLPEYSIKAKRRYIVDLMHIGNLSEFQRYSLMKNVRDLITFEESEYVKTLFKKKVDARLPF